MSPRKGYVRTEEGQVHYRHAGEPSRPSVVLLHQSPSSSQVFNEALAALRDQFHVVAPDLPGFGSSFAPERPPDVPCYADVVVPALEALGIEQCHLVGHHTGASVAARIATDRPDMVASVAFVGPPYLTEAERADRLAKYRAGAYEFPPLDEDGAYLQFHWEKYDSEGGDLEIQHRQVMDSLLARGNDPEEAYRAVWEQDFPALFDRIEAPRLLMAAPNDALWHAFERAREEHPSVRAVELSGGNFEPLLDVEGFTGALRSFLADVDGE